MKKLLIVLLVLFLVACGSPAVNEEGAIRDVIGEYFSAFNAYDYGRIVALLSDNVPREKIMEAVLFARGIGLVAEPTEIVVNINGDKAEAVVSFKGGSDTMLLVKQKGKWLIDGKISP